MFTVEDFKKITGKLFAAIQENRDYLGELDGKSGDGDLGISMHTAFQAMQAASESSSDADIGKMLFQMAKDCNKAAPSTMGTLISSGVMAMAKACKDKQSLQATDIVDLPRVFTDAIIARGKAQLGDKTILDALIPFCDAVETAYAETSDLAGSFKKGALAAEEASQATRGMRAKIGRAKWLGERAAEHPDAGAVLCAILTKALAG